jgi:hypothetical protein
MKDKIRRFESKMYVEAVTNPKGLSTDHQFSMKCAFCLTVPVK